MRAQHPLSSSTSPSSSIFCIRSLPHPSSHHRIDSIHTPHTRSLQYCLETQIMSIRKDAQGILTFVPPTSNPSTTTNTSSTVHWLILGIQLAQQMQSIQDGKQRQAMPYAGDKVSRVCGLKWGCKPLILLQEVRQLTSQQIHQDFNYHPVAEHRVHRSRCTSGSTPFSFPSSEIS